MSVPIRNVVVIGASGSVGVPVVLELLEAKFNVTALTRESSNATFPAGVKVFKSDYTELSLLEAFKGQDAIVSTIASPSTGTQKLIVDAAVASGVKVFLPSEYGIDTARPNVSEILPLARAKVDTVNYLKSVQDKISWAAVITGSLFDWAFYVAPGFGGWNIPARTATIFDGGNVPYEATNLGQTAKAVVAILKNPEVVKNQHVYVNSFTTTQNEVLRAFEKATGEKFTVTEGNTEGLWKDGVEKIQRGGPDAGVGRIQTIMAALYGLGGLNHYSVNPGLSNEKLGLKEESLDEVVKKIVEKL